jgi:hypothetical protein
MKAEEDCLTDALDAEMFNKNVDNFMISGNASLRFEVIKYMSRYGMLHSKNYSDAKITEPQNLQFSKVYITSITTRWNIFRVQ